MAEPQPLTEADRADLVAYLDGELAGDSKRRMENRLVTDPAVQAEADTLKRAWDLLDALPRPEPSTDFTTRTLNQISALKVPETAHVQRYPTARGVPWYRRRAAVVAGWAVAAIVALAIGFALTPGRRPPAAAEMDPVNDPLMTKEPGEIENLPLYLAVENMKYLQALDDSKLFSDDGTGR